MKKSVEYIQESSKHFEQEVYEALKLSGFDILKSDEEIQDFIENFGETRVELPEAFRDPKELFVKMLSKLKGSVSEETMAMAARGQKGTRLAPEAVQKLKSDLISGKRLKSGKRGHGRSPKK